MITASSATLMDILAGPKKPPAEVTYYVTWLLGILRWIGTTVGIGVLFAAGGFLWIDGASSYISNDPSIAKRRIGLAAFGGILLATASQLAWWVLA